MWQKCKGEAERLTKNLRESRRCVRTPVLWEQKQDNPSTRRKACGKSVKGKLRRREKNLKKGRTCVGTPARWNQKPFIHRGRKKQFVLTSRRNCV